MYEDLDAFSSVVIPAVEEEMRSVLKADLKKANPFYGMIHYHMGWCDANFKPVRSSAGKRIRPLLCLLSCEAAGGSWQSAVPGAAALEILHNFTLVHDDIQDASPTRRGRPTVWKIWGMEQAINSGDTMFALAHLAMSRLEKSGIAHQRVLQAIRRMDEISVILTYGQYSDMNFENRDAVKVQEYIDMIEGKTAALISFSCELGALIAGSDANLIDHYRAFGNDLGLGFQVRDDILGIWGDEELIGKSAATDIVTRKKSLPVLYGLEKSAELRALYGTDGGDPNFVPEAIGLLDNVGAKEFSEEHEERFVTSALRRLDMAKARSPAKEILLELASSLLNREK